MYVLILSLLLGHFLSPNPQLTVQVEGARSAKGNFLVAVFKEKEGFPREHDKALLRQTIKAEQASVQVVFEGLEAGRYAISVFHDENGNREADRNFLGFPKEGVGLSLNPSLPPPPTYERAAFGLETDLTLNITLKYF